MTAPERIWADKCVYWTKPGYVYPLPPEYILYTRAALAASPLVQEIVADAVREAARARLLEKALKVAMGYLAPHQPDDSSAVDDWFLACAAVQAELDDTDGWIEQCLDAAIRARGEG